MAEKNKESTIIFRYDGLDHIPKLPFRIFKLAFGLFPLLFQSRNSNCDKEEVSPHPTKAQSAPELRIAATTYGQ